MGGASELSLMTLVMSATVYSVLCAPVVFRWTKSAALLSAFLVAGVALGPKILADRAVAVQTARVQAQDLTALPFRGDVRVVDLFDMGCRTLCRELLGADGIQAVRALNSYGIVEVFALDAFGKPAQVPDTFADGDLTVTVTHLDDYRLKHEWNVKDAWFAQPDGARRLMITKGPANRREVAEKLFQKTDIAHAVPSFPTLFRAPTHGLVSGGNNGGVLIVRTKGRTKGWDNLEEMLVRAFADIGVL